MSRQGHFLSSLLVQADDLNSRFLLVQLSTKVNHTQLSLSRVNEDKLLLSELCLLDNLKMLCISLPQD